MISTIWPRLNPKPPRTRKPFFEESITRHALLAVDLAAVGASCWKLAHVHAALSLRNNSSWSGIVFAKKRAPQSRQRYGRTPITAKSTFSTKPFLRDRFTWELLQKGQVRMGGMGYPFEAEQRRAFYHVAEQRSSAHSA
jgi:hypothetical protein